MTELKNMFIVGGLGLEPPCGLSVTNWVDPSVKEWKKARNKNVTSIIVHESVTRSTADTVATLDRKNLGVHTMHGPDGSVQQHGDFQDAWLYHAGAAHNRTSVGVEVVNPYYPKYLKPELPWSEVISAPWAHEGKYVVPTMAQLESLTSTIDFLTSPASGLNIPRLWVGLDEARGRFSLGRVKGAEKTGEGIYAHHYFGHADGAFPVLYAWLRLEVGLSPCVAYSDAKTLTTNAKGYADVRSYLPHACV